MRVGRPINVARFVAQHWEKFLTHDDQGHERVIIEAISEGVVFTSMEHSVGEADAAAFLRPNLSDERIKEVIARAFSHAGKPYDFVVRLFQFGQTRVRRE